GGADHEQAQTGPSRLGIDLLDDGQRIGDVGAPPTQTGIGDLEIAARRRLAPAHADASRLHLEEAARLMLSQHAGDVVVDDDDLVGMALPLLGEDADGGGAATDPHALLLGPVYDGRLARPHRESRAAVDDQVRRTLVAEGEDGLEGDDALLLAAAGEMPNAAPRQHLRTVFRRRHMAYLLALAAHHGLLRPNEAVGIDFQFDAAIAEDALGHHRDRVDVAVPAGDDEGRGLVVGIGGPRTDA